MMSPEENIFVYLHDRIVTVLDVVHNYISHIEPIMYSNAQTCIG